MDRRVSPDGEAAGSAPAEAVAPREESEPAAARSGHWREDKIGLLMTLTSQESAMDPCPTIPETFVNPLRIPKLARAIKRGCPAGEDPVADPPGSDTESDLESPEYTPPAVRVKSMVASRVAAKQFGVMLAAAAQARV